MLNYQFISISLICSVKLIYPLDRRNTKKLNDQKWKSIFPSYGVAKCFFFLIKQVILASLGVFWYWFKTFIWKKFSKSKQTKCSGFVKLGVRWAEQDKYAGFYKSKKKIHIYFLDFPR